VRFVKQNVKRFHGEPRWIKGRTFSSKFSFV
jgi:hypothetical protein